MRFVGSATGGSCWKWGLLVVQQEVLLEVRFVGSATGGSSWKWGLLVVQQEVLVGSEVCL